jgi:hypothetical protein
VGDAAVDHQVLMHETIIAFAHIISSSGKATNTTWPLIRVPDFEVHAAQMRKLTGAETIGFLPFVEPKDEEAYLEFISANYEEVVKEAHMVRFGNLNRLTPIGYSPNFTLFGPDGIFPDPVTNRTIRMPFWYQSPRKSIFVFVLMY